MQWTNTSSRIVQSCILLRPSDLHLLQAHLRELTARLSTTLSVNLNWGMIPQHRFPSSMKKKESRCVSWHYALFSWATLPPTLCLYNTLQPHEFTQSHSLVIVQCRWSLLQVHWQPPVWSRGSICHFLEWKSGLIIMIVKESDVCRLNYVF